MRVRVFIGDKLNHWTLWGLWLNHRWFIGLSIACRDDAPHAGEQP